MHNRNFLKYVCASANVTFLFKILLERCAWYGWCIYSYCFACKCLDLVMFISTKIILEDAER